MRSTHHMTAFSDDRAATCAPHDYARHVDYTRTIPDMTSLRAPSFNVRQLDAPANVCLCHISRDVNQLRCTLPRRRAQPLIYLVSMSARIQLHYTHPDSSNPRLYLQTRSTNSHDSPNGCGKFACYRSILAPGNRTTA